MYTLKSIVRRGSALSSAVAIAVAAVVPAVLPMASAYADALNPLTHRSLTLSSSSPGWDYKDGSGNATYAPPNSGANGKQTGNTFSFNVSTDSSTSPTIKGLSFQYCTASAGNCTSPGDNGYNGTLGSYTSAKADSSTTSNLNVTLSSPSEVSGTSLFDTTAGIPTTIPNKDNSQGNFIVLQKDVGDSVWSQNAGWSMAVINKENGTTAAGTKTSANNYITLTNSSGGLNLHADGQVKVIFFGTDTNYITNPGSGAFFVKINDFKSDTLTAGDFDYANDLVDGGVTVANVMNRSIEIQTKVLETMDFSVGTVDPYTLDDTQLAASPLAQAQHGQCDRILPGMTSSDAVNTLALGDQNAESSLSTSKTYSTHSYWRLSSNSSAGATVYYSGVTLKNTVGDEVAAIGTTATAPLRGTPQFGLALTNGTISSNSPADGTSGHNYAVDYNTEQDPAKGVYENGADNAATGLATPGSQGIHSSVATDVSSQGLSGYHDPMLYPLVPESQYDQGAGVVNFALSGSYGTSANTKFAFDPNSNTIPAALASESSHVVDCVTGKVRYIANIAATTPAGIYTTKINYIAAPQY